MTLRWLEGWESEEGQVSHTERFYASVSGDITSAGEGASEVAGLAVLSDDLVVTTPALVGSATNTWIVGIAVKFTGTSTGTSSPYVAFENSDGEQIRFEFYDRAPSNAKPGGNYYGVRVMRGATELAASDQAFLIGGALSEWVYFEFKVTIDNSSGTFSGQFEHCRKPSVSGGSPTTITWDSASSSVDTQNQTSTGADRLTLSMDTGGLGQNMATDDIYVCDNAGSKNNDFLGRLLIEGQKPSADGNTTDWTLSGTALSTEDAWNEVGRTDEEDDKRLTSDTTSQVHLCTVTALNAISSGSAIIGLRQDITARMETAGDLDVAHFFRKTTGTPAETDGGTALNVSSTTYVGGAAILEDDPNTATTWDAADLDSYEHGVRNDG